MLESMQMTSGNFITVPVHSILIDRSERQRRELVGIEELAESIQRIGLIHPIVITADRVLVAGERRLTAVKLLGWTSIVAQHVEDLSTEELHILELEENIRRVDLSWQDQVAAIAKYHETRGKMDEDWKVENTAEELGLSPRHVYRNLFVARAVETGDERIVKADKFSVAHGLAERALARREATALASIPTFSEDIIPSTEPVNGEAPPPPPPSHPFLLADFTEWQATYDGPKFNLIHCDFPYGVNLQTSGQAAIAAQGGYDDGEDVYWNLLSTLASAMTNVVADSAHLIFWFSLDFYQPTMETLTEMGWRVNPFPLVWMKSDNTGILPDAKRGPRRIYETAFFASRGDRLLATGPHGQGPVANAFAHPGKDKSIHASEKPIPMLHHFLRLCCDEYSTVLDPTCGSGNAIRAAERLGAASVLGIERDPEFFSRTVNAYLGADDEV